MCGQQQSANAAYCHACGASTTDPTDATTGLGRFTSMVSNEPNGNAIDPSVVFRRLLRSKDGSVSMIRLGGLIATALLLVAAVSLVLNVASTTTGTSGNKYADYWQNEVTSSDKRLLCDTYQRYGLQVVFDTYNIWGFRYDALGWALPRYC